MAASDTLQDIKSKGILWGFGVLVLIVLVVLFILGAWWGSEPDQFNVQEEALLRAKETNNTEMPVGYTYANTLAHIAEVLLHKPGGYITNDVAPPGVFLDNISSWEFGALVMRPRVTARYSRVISRSCSCCARLLCACRVLAIISSPLVSLSIR